VNFAEQLGMSWVADDIIHEDSFLKG